MNHKSILIIEDEATLRETLSDLLEINGFNVSMAEDGKEGYKKILEIKPDLVICDVNMPGMSGFEVLCTVNSLMSEEILPAFLFVTARAQLEDIKLGMRLGADDYITKPFKSTDLLDTIRMRLDKRDRLLSFSKIKGEQNKPNLKDAETSIKPAFLSPGAKKIALPTGEGFLFVNFDDIVKCEADRSYCIFYLKCSEKIIISKPMKDFEAKLLEHGFLKVHKSHIVNMDFVKSYVRGKGGYLILNDGSSVNVSIRKKEEVISFLDAH